MSSRIGRRDQSVRTTDDAKSLKLNFSARADDKVEDPKIDGRAEQHAARYRPTDRRARNEVRLYLNHDDSIHDLLRWANS